MIVPILLACSLLQSDRVVVEDIPKGMILARCIDPDGRPLAGIDVLARTTESEKYTLSYTSSSDLV